MSQNNSRHFFTRPESKIRFHFPHEIRKKQLKTQILKTYHTLTRANPFLTTKALHNSLGLKQVCFCLQVKELARQIRLKTQGTTNAHHITFAFLIRWGMQISNFSRKNLLMIVSYPELGKRDETFVSKKRWHNQRF